MVINCWNCGNEIAGRFCTSCKALQPPATGFFEFFEIPQALALDLKDLERRFYALSRQLHPDLFSRKSEREKEYSLEATAVLNDGYRTLKDPVSRAQYVLKSNGIEPGEGKQEDPPELLEEVFELNMAIEELRDGDDAARKQVAEFRTRFEAMRADSDTELQARFIAWDAEKSPEVLQQIRGILNRRRYIVNLIAQTQTA